MGGSKIGRPKDRKKRDQAFRTYRKTKNLSETSRILDIDVSQLSKWKKEEDWDGRIEEIQQRVGERMGLEKVKEEQEIEMGAAAEQEHLTRLRELMIMAMESVEEGEVVFESMGEVRRAIKDYEEYRRLIEGKPNESRSTNINISLGGKGRDPLQAVEALLAIASSIQGDKEEERDVIDVTAEEVD